MARAFAACCLLVVALVLSTADISVAESVCVARFAVDPVASSFNVSGRVLKPFSGYLQVRGGQAIGECVALWRLRFNDFINAFECIPAIYCRYCTHIRDIKLRNA